MKQNIPIPEEFFDYLEANGYRRYDSEDGLRPGFVNDERKYISFKYDKATIGMYYDGSDDEAPNWSDYAVVDGISQLDLFKFMLVMHAFDIVPLKDFIRQAKKEITPPLFEDLATMIRSVSPIFDHL